MSRASALDELLKILQAGYLPYRGHVQSEVYQGLDCPKPRRARWFVQVDKHVCLGCAKQCALVSPEGFELVLPVSMKKRVKSCFAYLPQVNARQLLESKLLLRVDEAAFVLNISESEVRNYVDEGRLTAHPEPPLRVTVESVRKAMAYNAGELF
ncbi:DNA-binding protein [Desulfocurvibacter africanus]|uniref:DNA-binding protein n=1 Tax=Desulfocurvibacter africanus TaxID=873 RepID=UPI002FDA576E